MEDLDFSATGKIETAEFKNIISRAVKSDDRLAVRDLSSKYYTYLAEIKIKEPWQDIAFPIKIEISKRIVEEKDMQFNNVLAKSPATNISVMVRAFTLEQILTDKLQVIKERQMPRDIFDIWFICQKIGVPFDLKELGYPKGKIRQELRKFLPREFYPVVEELEKSNAQRL